MQSNPNLYSPLGLGRSRWSVLLSILRRGPLATLYRGCEIVQDHFKGSPTCRFPFLLLYNLLWKIHILLDSSFDRKHGIQTSGVTYSEVLKSENEDFGTRYEATPVKVFRRILRSLKIPFDQFAFIDFGSGKGRALILAAEFGFKSVTGIELVPELNQVASRNIGICQQRFGRECRIETVCADATKFGIPEVPVFVFFFSPFTGKVLKQVLDNIATSLAARRRDFVVLFYGNNPESIALLESVRFPPETRSKELHVCADWTQVHLYRCLVYSNVQGAG